MPVLVRIPTPLRGLTNGQSTVETQGTTLSEVLMDLEAKYPGIRDRLYDKKTTRLLFNIYLNKEDIRVLNKAEGKYEIDMNNPVKDGDQLSLIPPIAGGMEGIENQRHMREQTIRDVYESKVPDCPIVKIAKVIHHRILPSLSLREVCASDD